VAKKSRLTLQGDEYKKLCIEIMDRDGWRCRCCRARKNLHVHHIVFRSHQGDDASWNLITMCHGCHQGLHHPNPKTGACVVVISKSGKEIIDADDKKDTVFMLLNGFRPGRAA
jgi:hypothetical protein